jgi:ferric-dicitrate binding protein FerR (iron transport regulator)
MMPETKGAARFRELVSFYLDEVLDPRGVAELDGLLASQPRLAERFVRLARVHAGLRELQGPPVDLSPLRLIRRRRFQAVVIAIAVALAVGVGLLLLKGLI